MDAEAEAESFRLQGNERFREQRWGAAEQAYKEALRSYIILDTQFINTRSRRRQA